MYIVHIKYKKLKKKTPKVSVFECAGKEWYYCTRQITSVIEIFTSNVLTLL